MKKENRSLISYKTNINWYGKLYSSQTYRTLSDLNMILTLSKVREILTLNEVRH